MPNQNQENEKLLAKLNVLEEENMMLSERAEEVLLISLVSESINLIDDKEALLENVLERIGVLKDIPFCACIQKSEKDFHIVSSYATFTNNNLENLIFKLNSDKWSSLNEEETIIFNKEDFSNSGIKIGFQNIDFSPQSALAIKCNTKLIPLGFFLFIDDDKNENRFPYITLLLQQIVQITNDKLDKINLVNELKKLNHELENRVTERTSALNEINTKLKFEITEREIIQEALEESEEKFRELFNKANDAIYLWELNDDNTYKRLIEANDVAVQMSGYSKEELLQFKPKDLDSEKDKKNSSELLKEIISKGRIKFEIDHLTKSGKIIPVEISSHLFKLRNKKVILAITRDISIRKNTEIQLKNFNEELIESNIALKQAKEKAEESDRLKSAFLANISHEIRTPLNGIVGFASLLNSEKLIPEKRKKYINIINSSSNQLLNIINDIVDISKIEANQLELKLESCNLNSILDELFLLFNNLNSTNDSGLELILVKGLEDIDSFINSDDKRLRQVLINLLRNAFKYTDKGYIRFGYELKTSDKIANTIQFFIEDTGIGIETKEQKIIFERFRQADVGDKRIVEGAGLGLSISKGLVSLLGGKMWLESTLGKGSKFYFSLPYNTASDNIKISGEKHLDNASNSYKWFNKTILIVEDDITNYQYLKILLEDTKVNILHVVDGVDAVKAFQKHPEVDLILMDIRLPKLNGLEATKIIRETNEHIPIIAQTAYAMENEKINALKIGCTDYISKPIKRNKILHIINQYI